MPEKTLDFTGEYCVPGESGARIESDHFERYQFAAERAQGRTVLDLACGVGYAAPLLLEAGAKAYLGVDIKPDLVAYAGERYGSTEAIFANGDVCTFGDSESYDLITCFETIEHVADYREALSNLYRVLRPGGQLLISSPNRPITSPLAQRLLDPPSNKFHTQEFTPAELVSELRRANFCVDDSGVFGQRRRLHFRNRKINGILRRLFGDPDECTSPKVRRLFGFTPRYFVVVASKSRGGPAQRI